MIYYKIGIIAFLVLYLILLLYFLRPLKIALKVLCINGVIGLITLATINLISEFTWFYIPVNIVSVSMSSFLGPLGLGLFSLIEIIFL